MDNNSKPKIKVKFRSTNKYDLDKVYEFHKLCFKQSDQWYKAMFQHYIDKSFLVEKIEDNTIIGVLLQGSFVPCSSLEDAENFNPLTTSGELFKQKNLHLSEMYGICMVCVHPDYQGRGIAKKLIELHIKSNPNKVLVLNTRKSNPAYFLYKKMGYEHIANIKDKYFLPTEDSSFMAYIN